MKLWRRRSKAADDLFGTKTEKVQQKKSTQESVSKKKIIVPNHYYFFLLKKNVDLSLCWQKFLVYGPFKLHF